MTGASKVNESDVTNINFVLQLINSYVLHRLKSQGIVHILATTCPILMGFEAKCSICNAQIGCVEKLKLNFADMWPIFLAHVTNANQMNWKYLNVNLHLFIWFSRQVCGAHTLMTNSWTTPSSYNTNWMSLDSTRLNLCMRISSVIRKATPNNNWTISQQPLLQEIGGHSWVHFAHRP